jgi:hypothetical protein
MGPRASRLFERFEYLKVSEVVPGWWSHELQISDPRELDREVQGWLRRSYRLMGMQERLKSKSRRKQEPTPS